MNTRPGSQRRLLPVLLVSALLALLTMPLSASASSHAAGDGVLGTQVTGTGVLPNFSAQGSNLIRLLAGAFDPLSDPLPPGTGIPFVDESTLAPTTAQYWLTQV